jgi:hypothetical protein
MNQLTRKKIRPYTSRVVVNGFGSGVNSVMIDFLLVENFIQVVGDREG